MPEGPANPAVSVSFRRDESKSSEDAGKVMSFVSHPCPSRDSVEKSEQSAIDTECPAERRRLTRSL
jgi:hypothetical protein